MKRSLNAKSVAARSRTMLVIFLGMLAGGILAAGPARAADGDSLSKEDQACLKCHDKPGETKPLGNGQTLSLHVSTEAYLASMHKDTSCEDCHADIDGKTHGKVKTPLGSRRELQLSMQDSCITCHKKRVKEYGDSVHAAMVNVGSDKAPLCSDCHSPHTQKSTKLAEPIAATPCAKCHEDIFKAYAADVHGTERTAKGKSAPLCADCHQAHAVQAASFGSGVKDACLGCHKDAVAVHRDWLPNAGLHFEAISCPACHAPDAQRRVSLRLYDVAGGQVRERTGVPMFERMANAADRRNVGLDERALWSLLQDFSREGSNGGAGPTMLRGRLEVRHGVDAHRIAAKENAIRDCKTCHQAGASPFQSVALTIAGPDGRPLRHGVQEDVLSSLTATESVRGFYAIGANRIKLLDLLLVLVVLGAASVPLAHMTVKWLFRRVRAKVAAERAASAAPQPPNRTGDGPDRG